MTTRLLDEIADIDGPSVVRSSTAFGNRDVREAKRIQRFQWMLAALGVLFVFTQALAFLQIIPGLTKLSFTELADNPLFAVGFGCPLVLYLSSRPPRRDLATTGVIGLVCVLLLLVVRAHFIWPNAVVCFGLASLGMLAWRLTSNSRVIRSTSHAFFWPACLTLMFTLEAGVLLDFSVTLFPKTYDSFAYLADSAFGLQWSFAIGRLFQQWPWLANALFVCYVMPPPALMFVYALQVKARRPPANDIATVLFALATAGYCCYFLFPVCGPHYAFGLAFPNAPPGSNQFPHFPLPVGPSPRNGMPSLHFASALLAFWHVRPYGRFPRIIAAAFLAGTLLATLGLGEHYLVDLIVAVPFTLAIHAACLPSNVFPNRKTSRMRWTVFFGSAVLVAAWLLLVRFGTPVLLKSPAIPWVLAIFTLTLVLVWKRALRDCQQRTDLRLSES